jgi:hypothetical protein
MCARDRSAEATLDPRSRAYTREKECNRREVSLRGVLFVLGVLLVSACGAGNEPPEVPWGDYAPGVRTTIDEFAAAKDCAGLQQQFDQAAENSQATMARTGHSNADLMSYIDWQQQQAGCAA